MSPINNTTLDIYYDVLYTEWFIIMRSADNGFNDKVKRTEEQG